MPNYKVTTQDPCNISRSQKLIAWFPKIRPCPLDKAMSFSSLEAASIACDRANTTCKHMCHGMKFTVDGEATKKSERVSLYLTRSGKVAFEIIRTLNGKGEYSYRYHGKHGAGCGSLKCVVDRIGFVLQSKPSIKLAQGVDILQLK
jgi:hypothetical protein